MLIIFFDIEIKYSMNFWLRRFLSIAIDRWRSLAIAGDSTIDGYLWLSTLIESQETESVHHNPFLAMRSDVYIYI